MRRATSAYHSQKISYNNQQSPEVFEAHLGLEATPRNRYGFGLFLAKNKVNKFRKPLEFQKARGSKTGKDFAHSLQEVRFKPEFFGGLTGVNASAECSASGANKQLHKLQQMMRSKEGIFHQSDKTNVHFSQYVISDVKPKKSSGVLHSTSKRSCFFMKTPKQKGGQNQHKSSRRKSSPDNFKSIEIAKESKYVSVKKLGIGQNNPNKNLEELKKKLEKAMVSRPKSSGRRKTGEEEFWKPWETGREEADDHYLMD